ncbi:uncharacterized protein LOC116290248 [Actinia tenebrosa]|uniref:Uncharacterized protein LOC116290248 n=1 Tax=Actinia tenebrosa TaxID=6105 RepID=A0A6P8HKI2_ACTTE|nr:uncharacterized protein LOC116290248 [Actinia tenebrosa]
MALRRQAISLFFKPFARMFSLIGKKISEVDTPALLIDLDKFERNLAKLPKSMERFPGVAVRPHGKAHKCPTIAHLQVEHGAVGLCCQKLSEAESMVVAGIKDILISNEVIGTSKLYRLASLAKQTKLSVCVDNIQNAREISQAASVFGATVNIIVEVNVGQDRCGVEPGEPVVALAKEIISLPNLVFKGIQTYQGWNQHVRKFEDRQAAVGKVVEKTKKTLDALSANDIACEVVTGGGTGTYTFEAASKVFTEVQPGSYVFMDVDYGKNFGQDDKPFSDFEQSLFVLSTVISVTPGDRAVLDAGMKAVSLDSGPPTVKNRPELVYHSGGDEHGILRPSGDLKVGDQVWLIPGHCDPTVNMHDHFLGVRKGMVETVWPITGRGPGV